MYCVINLGSYPLVDSPDIIHEGWVGARRAVWGKTMETDLRRDGKVMKGDVEMWKDKMERSRERKRERGWGGKGCLPSLSKVCLCLRNPSTLAKQGPTKWAGLESGKQTRSEVPSPDLLTLPPLSVLRLISTYPWKTLFKTSAYFVIRNLHFPRMCWDIITLRCIWSHN